MTFRRDVELRLRSHFEDRADRSVQDGQFAGILDRTAVTRQRPAWLAALRSPSMTDLTLVRPTAFRSLPLVVVLALIAAGLIAALLLGIGRPKPPPFNGQIVIGRFNEALGDTEVFVMNPDGSHERKLLPGLFEGPNWSPDGRQIALGHAVINADGTGYHEWNQSRNEFHVECWDWSPDGQRMLCEGFSDDLAADAQIHGIYTVRASDGGDLFRLDVPGDGAIPGTYSPDGHFVAYIADTEDLATGRGSLFVVRTDGTERRQIGAFTNAGTPHWAPDGESLLVPIGGSLYSVDLDTTRATMIRVKNEPPQGIVDGQWSPDGTRLLIKRVVEGTNVELFTMLPDGTDLVRVTNNPAEERFFDWGTHPLD
jgi:hypothetical protein